MKLTASQFQRAADVSAEAASLWILPVNLAGEACGLSTLVRWAMWIAQCGHESGGFRRLAESMDYTVDALLKKFGRHRISEEDAREFGRIDGAHGRPANQREIANRVYGGEWGLKNLGNRPGTDDGWHYRGRGLPGLTGLGNFRKCGAHLGVDIVSVPELVSTDRRLAAEVSAWYWDTRGINRFADVGDIEGATKAINGGTNGLEDRARRFGKAMSALGVNAADYIRKIGAR